ncbi:UV DNA damage repair endonuclease UvsE [Acetonema longum]|uniref:Putative UV damage endonuclease n=1 Tax=Acetonema longum DSM 6540 TaxID=1009370 RepID=F7NEH3_9FIRM|nr:UV DNA damage repair endonuclease UvsE [Acetonema longum]EGO65384.1 putative UV damage endonuclease [Acetonema longum DSM 6540]
MRVRFGYVAKALGIPNGSPNQSITLKKLKKVEEQPEQLDLLRRILAHNLEATRQVLYYNQSRRINVYRFSSRMVPLASHPVTKGWDYIGEFRSQWHEIGAFVTTHGVRVSAHPDHLTLLSTPKKDVLAAALRELAYHGAMFDAMGLPYAPQFVLHAGGVYKNKASSLERFVKEYQQLPDNIRLRIIIENDDKSYDASDVLPLCQKLGCPMVFDLHHHQCLQRGENLGELWADIVATWGEHTPKIHLSSAKSAKDPRPHAAYVHIDDFLPFLHIAKELDRDFDVMLEAKEKDRALAVLMKDLEKAKGIKRLEPASIVL